MGRRVMGRRLKDMGYEGWGLGAGRWGMERQVQGERGGKQDAGRCGLGRLFRGGELANVSPPTPIRSRET